MDYITLGRITIASKWIVLACAILISYGILRYFTKYKSQKILLDVLSNSLFLGIVVLKLSLLIVQPKLVMHNPLSLLYFTGGTLGFWLAIILSSIYYFFKANQRKEHLKISLSIYLLFFFSTFTLYHLLAITIMHDLHHALFLLVSLFFIIWYFIKRKNLKSLKNLIIGSLLIGLVTWVIYDHQSKNQTDPASSYEGINEGDQATNFTLKTLEGKKVSLSDYKGKKVLLNFWATWCPPCKAEMPNMEEFYKENAQKNIIVLAVNLTSAEPNEAKVKNFTKEYGLTFPVLLDSEGDISELYHTVTAPTSFFIDETGVIREKVVGPMSKEAMTSIMKR